MSQPLFQSRTLAWAVWMIASIFYAYQYIIRVMPSIMIDDIMLQFDVGAAAFGQFSGIYYIGYSLAHLPIGIMLDRYGPKKVMSGCIFMSVLGLLPLMFSHTWIYPVVGRALIGIGSSAAILGVFKIVRMTFTKELFPRMLSLSVTIGLIGAIYGGGPLVYMTDAIGYQGVLQFFALAGILLAIATYLIIPEIENTPKGSVGSEIWEVLSNFKVLLCCLFTGLMVGPLEGFADAWGAAFFRQVYGFEPTLAASFPSLIFIGMCFGGPILTAFSEKVKNPFIAIITAGIIMIAIFLLMLSFQLSSTFLSIGLVIVGICCGYQILTLYMTTTFVRDEVAGLTTAITNMIVMIFGYAFHSTIGTVVNMSGGAEASQALQLGISVIPAALCFGTFGFTYFLQMASKGKTAVTIE